MEGRKEGTDGRRNGKKERTKQKEGQDETTEPKERTEGTEDKEWSGGNGTEALG